VVSRSTQDGVSVGHAVCHTWVSERSRSNRPVLSLVRTPRITYDAEMPRGRQLGCRLQSYQRLICRGRHGRVISSKGPVMFDFGFPRRNVKGFMCWSRDEAMSNGGLVYLWSRARGYGTNIPLQYPCQGFAVLNDSEVCKIRFAASPGGWRRVTRWSRFAFERI
jgi:hypothetical protein